MSIIADAGCLMKLTIHSYKERPKTLKDVEEDRENVSQKQ